MNYGLERLRGIDDKFVYELNLNPNDIDSGDFTVEDIMKGYTYLHSEVVRKAKEFGIGYRRWKLD